MAPIGFGLVKPGSGIVLAGSAHSTGGVVAPPGYAILRIGSPSSFQDVSVGNAAQPPVYILIPTGA